MTSLKGAIASAILGALLLCMPSLWPMKPAPAANETVIHWSPAHDH